MTDPSLSRSHRSRVQPFAAGFADRACAARLHRHVPCRRSWHLMAHVSRWLHARDLDVGESAGGGRSSLLQARLDAG